MTVRKIENGKDWALWRSDVVENNIEQMSIELGRAYRLFTETFTGCNSSLTNVDPFTNASLKDLPNIFENMKKEDAEDEAFLNTNQDVSGYRFYNVFSLTTPSPLFWELFQEIKYIVEQQFDYKGPKWIQCWLNYHRQDEVLDWHNHAFPMHGYVSIRPHFTTTTFGFNANGGNVNAVNENSIPCIAYCFRSITGFSQAGQYTGNGASNGTFVYTGFAPSFVMIKNTDLIKL